MEEGVLGVLEGVRWLDGGNRRRSDKTDVNTNTNTNNITTTTTTKNNKNNNHPTHLVNSGR